MRIVNLLNCNNNIQIWVETRGVMEENKNRRFQGRKRGFTISCIFLRRHIRSHAKRSSKVAYDIIKVIQVSFGDRYASSFQGRAGKTSTSIVMTLIYLLLNAACINLWFLYSLQIPYGAQNHPMLSETSFCRFNGSERASNISANGSTRLPCRRKAPQTASIFRCIDWMTLNI